MKFYNREEELKEIRYFYNTRPSMLVLTGRRRVGKTELIKRIKKQTYFFVDPKKSEKMMLDEFFFDLKRDYKINDLIKVETWEDLLKLIFDLAKKEKVTIAFDEFQRFLRISPSVIFQMQKYWDLNKDSSKVMLIFSGSSIGMMKKIFSEENAPLFKRAQNILTLKPFYFEQVSEILKDLGVRKIEEKIKIYFMFGGIINYYSLMDFYKVKSFEGLFDRLILKKYAPLKDEIADIFIEEFGKEHKTYYSILKALSLGKNTKKEIEDLVDIKSTSLSPYLYDLNEILGIVTYKIPFDENKNSKKGRYFIADNFFKFWFKFIFDNMNHYEIEEFSYIKDMINKEFNTFAGQVFEDLCTELIIRNKVKLPFVKDKVAKWWGFYRDKDGKRKEVEIDIVVANEKENKILFVECKWKNNVNVEKVISELKNKAQFVKWHGEKREEFYAVFAKSFKRKIIAKNIILFDLNDFNR